MTMQDIQGKKVKLSAHTITVKGENGKTCGMVRGVTSFTELQPNMAIKYFKTIKAAGLWGIGGDVTKRVIIADGNVYYLHNLRNTSDKATAIRDKAAEYVTVINCYIQ